ncbi:hypothetical protein BDY19DRAFT_902999 [Irpex rosettiformis]|uniref:Uncharacterized protein n=1 Tax=Irpex rosettiformis TaxID=378272 RepID=A0ACB8UGP8_9APHY|nr:hypothetical protein BDY19DRAFT_902999 [Irpex rosettiformis]
MPADRTNEKQGDALHLQVPLPSTRSTSKRRRNTSSTVQTQQPGSLEHTVKLIDQKAQSFKDEEKATFKFAPKTSISSRVMAACVYRRIDPKTPFIQVGYYVFNDGQRGPCCPLCAWANPQSVQKFCGTNLRIRERHPLGDAHLQALGSLLRVEWECLRNILICPYCESYGAMGERTDQLAQHINIHHPEHKEPPKLKGRKKQDLKLEAQKPDSPPTSWVLTEAHWGTSNISLEGLLIGKSQPTPFTNDTQPTSYMNHNAVAHDMSPTTSSQLGQQQPQPESAFAGFSGWNGEHHSYAAETPGLFPFPELSPTVQTPHDQATDQMHTITSTWDGAAPASVPSPSLPFPL